MTASDINTICLEKCRSGIYSPNALRMGDGEIFKSLIKPYIVGDKKIVFSNELKSKINTLRINLAELDTAVIPIVKQDVIFIRNVFIYFSVETRAKILKTLADKFLNDGGVIIVSMSEIAQIDASMIPPSLEKVSDENIFYFKKKGA